MKKKWLAICGIVCLFVEIFCGIAARTSEAAAVERVDGLLCWNGDMNYPLWSSGQAIGSALNVRSADILFEDGHTLQICVESVTINYKQNAIIEREMMRFEESDGTVYYWHQNGKRLRLNPGKEDRLFGSMNDAYYAVKAALGKV